MLAKYGYKDEEKQTNLLDKLDFEKISTDNIYQAVRDISKDIERAQSVQIKKFSNIDDSELFFLIKITN